VKISKKYIEQFNPCKDRWDNYLKYYKSFSGSMVEFLELENISWSDKKWVLFHEDQKILSDDLMREFALICACRAVEQCDSQEIKDYYDLVLLIYTSKEIVLKDSEAYSAADWAAYRAACSAAYRAADWAACSAVDWAAAWAADAAADWAADAATEEDIQKDILINLIEEEWK